MIPYLSYFTITNSLFENKNTNTAKIYCSRAQYSIFFLDVPSLESKLFFSSDIIMVTLGFRNASWYLICIFSGISRALQMM